KIFGDEFVDGFGGPRVIPFSPSYQLFIIGDSPPPSPYSVNSGIPQSNQSQVLAFSSGSEFSAISSDKFGQCSAPISSIVAPNKGIVPVTKASAVPINVTDSPTTSYVKLVTSEPSRKYTGNVSVWVKLHGVLMTKFNEDGLSAIATKLGNFLMLDSYTSDMCIQSRGRSNFTRAMIELWAVVELKDTIVVAMPKLVGEGFYMCIICVEYECKAPRCSCYKVFDHVLDKCPMNIGFNVAKNLKNPIQVARGVPVGLKVGFKAVKQVYRPVSDKNIGNTSGKKKQYAVSRKEVVSMANMDSDSEVKDVVTAHGGFMASKGLKRG
nr:hypothetical protein [Tanacetum cinerariifolium]